MTAFEVPQPPAGTRLASLRGLWIALERWHGAAIVAVASNLVAHAATAVAGAASALAVARAVLGEPPAAIAPLAIVVLIAIVVRGLASWTESWVSHDVSFRVMARVRGWIFGAIGRVAPAGLARRRSGDIATTALSDSEALEVFFAHSSIYIVSAWITTPVMLLAVAVLSPWAALAVVPLVVVVVSVTLALRARARRVGADIRAIVAALGAEVQEDVGAVREIVADGLGEARLARLDALDSRLALAQRASTRRAGLENALVQTMSIAAAAACALVGVVQASTGVLAAELVPVLASLGGLAPAAIVQWVGVTRHHGTTAEAAARIEVLLEQPSPVDRSGTEVVEAARAGLAASCVRFAWPSGVEAVRGIDLGVEPGEVVAICGRSGAGKSTLAWLLARHVQQDAGTIAVGDVPTAALSREGLADAVCLVPQEVHLFRETVRDNLLLATDEPVADAALWQALEATLAADIVRGLSDGLDTLVDDRGRSLSGGERQRIALARAIVAGPRVLVLDESVSQLDVESEADVSRALAERGHTTIVIAHRLSTLLRADRIVVLDAGAVVGVGSHAALLESSAAYRALVEPQLAALSTTDR